MCAERTFRRIEWRNDLGRMSKRFLMREWQGENSLNMALKQNLFRRIGETGGGNVGRNVLFRIFEKTTVNEINMI